MTCCNYELKELNAQIIFDIGLLGDVCADCASYNLSEDCPTVRSAPEERNRERWEGESSLS